MPEPAERPSPESPEELNRVSIELMAKVAKGDERAFQYLVELHQHAVIGTVAKMLGNANDAHDIAQMVFVRVWKSAERYKPSAKFTTWLFTITRNLVFNEMRRLKRRKEVSIEGAEEDYHITMPGPEHDRPDATALQTELEDALEAAIAQLPEKQRMAVVLRRFEGMPYEELAGVLEISVPALKSLLFRARTELRTQLGRYLDSDESDAAR